MMKRSMFFGLALILSTLVLSNCSEDDEPISEFKNAEFLALYKPSSEQLLGADKLVARLSLKDGVLYYSTFMTVYPGSSMTIDCAIKNNKMAMGLEWRAFDNQGIYLDIDDDYYEYLPLATPKNDNYYNFFGAGTQNVSDNGYIIYISGTNNKSYGDEGRRNLMRYKPADGSVISIPSPVEFALSQPEKGGDTDFAQFNSNIFSSTNGRYAYGHIEAFGTEGGGIHWDYEFLFQFDFETMSFSRLGDAEDDNVSIYAMTSDRKYLIYANDGAMKMLNLETGVSSSPDPNMNLINVRKCNWNKYGACVGTSNGYVVYKNFVNDVETDVCKASGSIQNSMFSANGEQIYFIIRSDKKYLCLTDNLLADSPYDTLCVIPEEFYDMVLIK